MPLLQCGDLGRNNEKDICTLVLKTGLVIILDPHIRQSWPYLKINQIGLTNRLKAKHLWGCSNSIILNVPVELNEVVEGGPGDHCLFTAKPLDRQLFCVYSISFCPNSHWYLPQCTPNFSKNAFSMSTCTNLLLPLWAAVDRGDSSKGHRHYVSRRQETWGNTFWSTLSLFHYHMSLCLAELNLHPKLFIYFHVNCHPRARNKPSGIFSYVCSWSHMCSVDCCTHCVGRGWEPEAV